MGIYDQLIKDGFYLGSSLEIFTSKEIENIRECIIKDIDDNFAKKENNNWKYFLCCDWPDGDFSKNKSLNFDEIPKKLNQVQAESAVITQSWYWKDYVDLLDKPIPHDVMYNKLNSYIAKIYNINKETFSGYPSITYYSKNDFIAVHDDGKNLNRVCGMLIYFNSEDDYKKEYGGKLLLQPASKTKILGQWDYEELPIQVDPVSPNMVLFDFTKHNILHAVEKCYTSFYRTALICFFTLHKSSEI